MNLEIKSASPQNPAGLQGVEFVEFAGHSLEFYKDLFGRFGFEKVAQVSGRKIELYRQGKINLIANCEPGSFAWKFADQHGPSICSTGFRTVDGDLALESCLKRGAKSYDASQELATPFPAIFGIGNSLVYLMDQDYSQDLFAKTFAVDDQNRPFGVGLSLVDHFTNNVPRGEMQKWCDFYTQIFGFRETRYFDIKGSKTGLISKVMRSPCGTFAVPINEPTDTKSQIQEYLDEYHGSGIQHLAFQTEDILKTLVALKTSKIEFLTPPPRTYYAMLKDRLPNMVEDIKSLESHAVLADGDPEGYLLQIFTKNIIGPIFFELIQRENHAGFGEGNFQALFDAIERDQQERGYL